MKPSPNVQAHVDGVPVEESVKAILVPIVVVVGAAVVVVASVVVVVPWAKAAVVLTTATAATRAAILTNFIPFKFLKRTT